MIIYYAHPMSWYDTTSEKEDIAYLEQFGTVINPNTQWFRHKVDMAVAMNYPIMQVFADFIKEKADVVAYRAFKDGEVGSGVAREVFEARIWDKQVWHILGSGETRHHTHTNAFEFDNVMTVYDTKDRVRQGVM